jgi:hypothetical protein
MACQASRQQPAVRQGLPPVQPGYPIPALRALQMGLRRSLSVPLRALLQATLTVALQELPQVPSPAQRPAWRRGQAPR